MASFAWQDVDQAHMRQQIILLQMLNHTPGRPSETAVSDRANKNDDSHPRTLSLRCEKAIAESFTFLAAITDDPQRVLAVCVEERQKGKSLAIRMAVNHGDLEKVKTGLRRVTTVLERVAQRSETAFCLMLTISQLIETVSEQEPFEPLQRALLREVVALNQNRILIRLQSSHATLKCNYKKVKQRRPKLIQQLSEAVKDQIITTGPRVTPPAFALMKADLDKLGALFVTLESMTPSEARSQAGLNILIEMVMICQQVQTRQIIDLVLARSPRLDPTSRKKLATVVTKISRYYVVSRFLHQAAQKFSVFSSIEVLTVKIRAPKLPVMELDPHISSIIHGLPEIFRRRKMPSNSRLRSVTDIEEYLRQGASSPSPVHAEIQLLYFYEGSISRLPPRIICSSKKACFLCNLFFKLHGKFIIPSTHGRLYEKWALPEKIEGARRSPGEGLTTTLQRFSCAVDDALTRETQSTRKPYPCPYESAILLSAACLLSDRSNFTSHHSTSAIERGRISSPLTRHTLSPLGRPSENNALQLSSSPASEFTGPVLHPCDHEKTELLTKAIDNESVRDLLPERLLLERGQQIWRKLSPCGQEFKVVTPRIHLNLSHDQAQQIQLSHGRQCWVELEWLSEKDALKSQDAAAVNLYDLPEDSDKTIEYSGAERPKELYICRDRDIISVRCSLYEPLNGQRQGE